MVKIRLAALVAVQLLASCLLFSQDEFGKYFKDETCRFDYVHTGTKGSEQISLDKISVEGAWPGSLTGLIDTLNLGEYEFKIFAGGSDHVIYSRGFSTIFNEWQTTDEAARGAYRAFGESVRFPLPVIQVRLEIYRRNKSMAFQKIFATAIDPSSVDIIRERLIPNVQVTQIIHNGPPHEKVDLVILGDGYTAKDMKKFLADVRHYTDRMFSTQPFKSRRKDFNVWAASVPSDDSGIDQPDKNIWKRTALGTSYNTFGSARYVLTMDNDAVRKYAALAPYDFMCVLVNTNRYGGGGIFQLYATCFTGGETKETAWYSDYVFVHEFGHCFGGLGDEYYTSDVPYTDFLKAGVEPWEPNIASNVTREKLKWGDLVSASTPLPTEWRKDVFDSLSAVPRSLQKNAADYNEKRREAADALTRFLDDHPLKNVVGAFEGAGYMSKGLYRPAVNCRMFSKSLIDFDPVCSRAIGRMIDLYSK
jgi:hypothetical protein